MKPIIGILAKRNTGDLGIGRLYTNLPYIEAVSTAGGMPLLLPVSRAADAEALETWITLCHGLLIPGGYDLAPAFYGQDPLPQVSLTNRTEDMAELNLVQLAQSRGIPLLGVCRGLQVMNVALGGTLWQDLPAQKPHAIGHYQHSELRDELFHTVHVREGSLLHEVVQTQQLETNSFHHQAVAEVAKALVVTAQTADGVIEALENSTGTMLGVQWHPEGLCSRYARHAALFAWLIQAAKQYRAP